MTDSHPYVYIIIKFCQRNAFLINFQPHIVIDVIRSSQLNGVLAVPRLSLHVCHSVRRIVIEIGRIRRIFPIPDVCSIRFDDACRICILPNCIHFYGIPFRIEGDFGRVVIQRILVKCNKFCDRNCGLRPCPGNWYKCPSGITVIFLIKDSRAQIIPSAEWCFGQCQRGSFFVVCIDIEQECVFFCGIYKVGVCLINFVCNSIRCSSWESI